MAEQLRMQNHVTKWVKEEDSSRRLFHAKMSLHLKMTHDQLVALI